MVSFIEIALGLEKGKLLNRVEPHGVQNALCYEKTPPEKWGVPPHYDNGFLTILMQEEIEFFEYRMVRHKYASLRKTYTFSGFQILQLMYS